MVMKKRCEWATGTLLEKYHDWEWGVPLHNDSKLFEFLMLDGAQAGLSWSTILAKRKSYKKAFDSFAPRRISKYKSADIKHLLKDAGIVRNRMKIESAVNNAKRFLEVAGEFGTFDKYIWSFVGYKTITNRYKRWNDVPSFTKESQKMSYDLKKRGFSFVGRTICYAFMQSTGMVNDHVTSCFRYYEVNDVKQI